MNPTSIRSMSAWMRICCTPERVFDREIRAERIAKTRKDADREEDETLRRRTHKNNQIQWLPPEWRLLTRNGRVLHLQGALQRCRKQGNHDLVVTGQRDGLAAVLSGAFQHVLSGTVVLNEVQICRCELLQAVSQISHNGNRLQENLGKQYRRSHVQINAAAIEFSHNGAEESEIVEAGFADRFSGRRWMRVNRVGSHGDMHGDRESFSSRPQPGY